MSHFPSQRKIAAVVLFGAALFTVLHLRASAADGSGTNVVSPTSTTVGSAGNTFTFTFTPAETMDSGEIRISTPSGWSSIQGTNGVAGHTTVATSVGTIADVVNTLDTATNWTATQHMALATSTDVNASSSPASTFSLSNAITASAAANEQWYFNYGGATDWGAANAGTSRIGMWVKSSVATASGNFSWQSDNTANLTSPEDTVAIPALAANAWTYTSVALGAARAAQLSYGFRYTTDIGAATFNADSLSSIFDNADATTNWSGSGGNVAVSALNTAGNFQEGTAAIRCTFAAAAAAGDKCNRTAGGGSNFTIGPGTTVGFWVRSSVALNAGDFQWMDDGSAGLGSPEDTVNLPALAANTWTYVTLTAANSANKSVRSYGFNQAVDKGALTFDVDAIGKQIDAMDGAAGWTAPTAAVQTLSADSVTTHEGTASLKNVITAAAAAGDTWYQTFGATQDWSAYTTVGFWIRSTVGTNAGDLQFQYSTGNDLSSPIATVNVGALAANTWTFQKLTLSGTRTAVKSYGIKYATDIGAATVNLDDVLIGPGSPTFAGGAVAVRLLSLATGQTAVFSYGNGGGANGVTAPSTAQTNTATTTDRVSDSGTLANIASQPTLSAVNPVPTTTSISPTSTTAAGSGFTLTVNGTNFVSSSTVNWNGSPRTTTFVSSSSLTAAILAADIANTGTASVTVVNTTPGGGTSNAQTFTITAIPTATSLISSVNPSIYGNSVTFTATVTPTVGGAPTGTVTFKDGSTVLGTANLNGANPGVAAFSTSSLSVAASPHSVAAVYSGGGNFAGSTSNAVSQVVTARSLTVSATASNKVYDGTASATVSLSDNRITGDILTVTFTSASFADRNVGVGKTVTVSGINVTGASAPNYTFNTSATTTATITARALTVTAAANTKAYDGTTAASSTPTITAGALQDADTASFTETYDTKNAGTGKTLTPSGTVTDGNGGLNYAVTFVASTNGVITAKTVTPHVTAANKLYDATTTATITSRTLTGVIGSEDVSLVGGTANFDTPAVGTGKTVTATGLSLAGADAPNYILSSTSATTTADIAAIGLTVAGITANDKTYDGTTAATLNTAGAVLVGVATGDTNVTLDTTHAVGTFADANVGLSKLVTISGLALTGTSAGNYLLTQPTTTASILNPVPVITSISPTSTIAGSGGFTLSVNGSGFVAPSIVDWNGSPRATTFVSSSSLTAAISAADVSAAGTASVMVVNAAPGGGTSNAATFTILSAAAPTITSFTATPSSITPGSSSLLAWQVSNFISLSIDQGVGDVTSATSTTVTPAQTTTYTLTAVNNGGASSTAQVTVTVQNPVPAITNLSPSSAVAGNAGFTLAVDGSGFIASSTVQWNGSPRTTAVVSAARVTAQITAGDIASAGTSTVTVTSPAPGGGTSNALDFSVTTASAGTSRFEFANVSSSATAGDTVTFNIFAVDASGTIDTAFQQGVTLGMSGSARSGGLVTIVNGIGTTTVTDNIAETVTLSLQDTQLTGLNAGATAFVTFVAGPAAQLSINHPGNMNVGTRLGFTVGRKDQFGNMTAASGTAAFLYSDSASANAAFFDAASGGTAVTSVAIPPGSTSTPVWFFDDTSGTRNVTVSDNALAPDGAAGFADASDAFLVAPGAVRFMFANVPASVTAGTPSVLNLFAVDSLDRVDPSYNGTVTVTLSGAATGGGAISLANGVGTTTVSDLTAETVALGLIDSAHSGLGVSATTAVTFSAAPAPTPTPGPTLTPSTPGTTGGGGGGAAPTTVPFGINPGIAITFSGSAYPGASVVLIRKDQGFAQAPVTQEIKAAADGSFLVQLNNVLRLGGQTYLLSFKDKDGRIAQTKAYNIPVQDKLIYANILAAPTLGFANSSVVTMGGPLVVSGYATPGATVAFFIDGNPAGTVVVKDPTGAYRDVLATDSLASGRHSLWAIQRYAANTVTISGYVNPISENELFLNSSVNGTLLANASGTYRFLLPGSSQNPVGAPTQVSVGGVHVTQAESDFSNQESFTVSPLGNPKFDLNGDGTIDVRDLSIFLSYLKNLAATAANFRIVSPDIVHALDFDGNGSVGPEDLQILVAAMAR